MHARQRYGAYGCCNGKNYHRLAWVRFLFHAQDSPSLMSFFSVSVTTQSIVQFLPARTDSDERRASGEKDDPEKERAEQLKAAEKRKVAWVSRTV